MWCGPTCFTFPDSRHHGSRAQGPGMTSERADRVSPCCFHAKPSPFRLGREAPPLMRAALHGPTTCRSIVGVDRERYRLMDFTVSQDLAAVARSRRRVRSREDHPFRERPPLGASRHSRGPAPRAECHRQGRRPARHQQPGRFRRQGLLALRAGRHLRGGRLFHPWPHRAAFPCTGRGQHPPARRRRHARAAREISEAAWPPARSAPASP